MEEVSSQFTFFSLGIINNHHRCLRRKIRQLSLPKSELWNWYSNVWFFTVKLNLFFTELPCTYIVLGSPHFKIFPCLLYSASNHCLFSYQVLKNPEQPFQKNKTKYKTHIRTPPKPLMKLPAKFEMYFHVNLGLCTALLHNHFHLRFEHIGRTIAFLPFILSFPPLEVMGIWQAPSLDSQTTGGTWFQFLHPVISDSRDILFLQG